MSCPAECVTVDKPSVDMLMHHCPWLLKQYVPASVAGDGNCLFRAVSVALYGHESAYCHLCLLTTTEVLMNRTPCNFATEQFYELYRNDPGLVLPRYTAFVMDVV